jgi:succinyl-CoA synthetase alpha subunit
MSILLSAETTFIVQGITGREAVNLTRECLDYGEGAKVVGGVTPGRKGRDVHGVPVFDTVQQAVEHHGGPINGSVVTVPPAFTKDAVIEAIVNGIELVVIVTERIPRGDVAQMVEFANMHEARIIGPNCLGIIVPDVIKMGGIGGPAKDAGQVLQPRLDRRHLALGRHDDRDVLDAQRRRPGHLHGGLDRRRRDHRLDLRRAHAALRGRRADRGHRHLHRAGRPHGGRAAPVGDRERLRLPIVAFMAGRFMDEMPGMSFGHAGTIVEGKEDTATEKIARLAEAGITVAEEISQIPDLVKQRLGVAA